MRQWRTTTTIICEVPFDHDFHRFAVYNAVNDQFLGWITPVDRADMHAIIRSLDNGADFIHNQGGDGSVHTRELNRW